MLFLFLVLSYQCYFEQLDLEVSYVLWFSFYGFKPVESLTSFWNLH